MNSRALAALLSSLISQLLILLFPPSTYPNPSFSLHQSLFPLLHHFLSASDISATFSLLSLPRKRKRPHSQHPDPDPKPHRVGSFPSRSPDSLNRFFGMTASSFEWLCGLLDPLLDCRDPVGSRIDLPAEDRLGIGLFRLATGADYAEISSRFGVSEADSRFCVRQLCRVLCTNYRFWVGFPVEPELGSVSARFETLTGLPNCCGIMSCVRFDFENDGNERESVAAQLVVDSSSRILSVVAGFRGNKSDMRILKSSTLYEDIEKGVILNSGRPINVNGVDVPKYLVGNGEYDLLPWLMVPFVDPQIGSVEESFNRVHRLMRGSSVKAVASLRNWGVLNRPVKIDYKNMVACIGACCILHNMLIAREDYSSFSDEFDDGVLNSYRNAASLEGNLIEEKAFVIRNALATRAKI